MQSLHICLLTCPTYICPHVSHISAHMFATMFARQILARYNRLQTQEVNINKNSVQRKEFSLRKMAKFKVRPAHGAYCHTLCTYTAACVNSLPNPAHTMTAFAQAPMPCSVLQRMSQKCQHCCTSALHDCTPTACVRSLKQRQSICAASGMKGGSVLNPINALANLLAGMVDDNNHITVEGFYK